eukprot:NODE_293_length_11597_cov_0.181771.p6 type:complete len:184 gc:universal NODE_293_length_11597_cov_0.181771:5578-5027(-)
MLSFLSVVSASVMAKSTKVCSDATVALSSCYHNTPLRNGSGAFAGPDEVNTGSFSKERCTSCKDLSDDYFIKCFDGPSLDYLQATQTLQCLKDGDQYCAVELAGTSLPEFDCNSKCSAKWATQLAIVKQKWELTGTSSTDANSKLAPKGWTSAEIDAKCGSNFLAKNSAPMYFTMPLYYLCIQ